jgi:hypothetical protein
MKNLVKYFHYLHLKKKKMGAGQEAIWIVCHEASDTKTSVSVTYTYTSLGEEVNTFLETFTQ